MVVYPVGVTYACQPAEPQVIAITGGVGAARSALGHALATRVGAPLVDLDPVAAGLSAVAEAVRATRVVVMVGASMTELTAGPEWTAFTAAAAPAGVRVVRLVGEQDAVAAPTVAVDAELTTVQQLERLLPALGWRAPLDERSPLFGERFDAVFFDLDGTLIDSTASVIRCWRRFAEHYGVDMQALHENHGQPARTLIARLLPPELREEGFDRITGLEVADTAGLSPVLGAVAFYAGVPQPRRAVVTSGSVAIATARRRATGFPLDDCLVTVEDVTRGKPDPEPYLVAARRLGVDPARCLVVEDAPAGIAAARAAGCAVLAVAGTLAAGDLDADLVVDGLDRVEVFVDADGGLGIRPTC